MGILVLFHNPACSKSRQALTLLESRGAAFEKVEYLKTPPGHAMLRRIVAGLDTPPTSLVRRDKRFGELGLSDAACATTAQVVDLLAAHPELMERPILLGDQRAVIGRPPERVLELLD